MENSKIFLFILILLQLTQRVIFMPISVPVDNNNYPDISDRRPNAYYNRLPSQYPVQTDDVSSSINAESDNSDDDYDEQTDKPVQNQNNYQSSQNNGNYNFLLTENRVKRRKKKVRRPCIPIQSLNSQLFSNNRLRREINDKESGKTLGLLFGGYNPFNYPPPIGSPFYGNQYYGGGGYPGGNQQFFDNVKPQYDTGSSSSSSNLANPGPVQYNPIGGYPCVPISYGHIPHGGPFGFFGQGGLFDFGSNNNGGGGSNGPLQSPTFNYPQTVIINRPPLFGNNPFFNKPGGGSGGSFNGGSGSFNGGNNDGIGDNRPGFWGSVVDKLQEFVTSVNPQQVFTAIGDTLQGLGDAIQNAQPVQTVASATDTIRQGFGEFRSLLFR